MAAANTAREIARPGEETDAEPAPRDRRAAVADLKEVLDCIRRARALTGRALENPAVQAESGTLDDTDGYLEYAARDVRLLLGLLEH